MPEAEPSDFGVNHLQQLFGPSTSQLFESNPESERLVREAEAGAGSELNSSVRREWTDETTLETLKRACFEKSDVCWNEDLGFTPSDMSDDVSSASSSDDADSNSDDNCRSAEIDGEKNASDLVAPSDLAGKSCFKHVKSGKLHFIGRTAQGEQIFKCGRRCNSNYVAMPVVPAFTAHGCMTCFGWNDSRRDDESSE